MSEKFLYPLLYTGPRDRKEMNLAGVYDPFIFEARPDAPYTRDDGTPFPACFVTEDHGRQMLARCPQLFKWPEGLQLGPTHVTREEYEAVCERLAALELLLAPKASKQKAAV